MEISKADLDELKAAKLLLENPGIAAKITNVLGTPIEKGFELLPENWRDNVNIATKDALMFSLKSALLTMKDKNPEPHPIWHKIAATISGGVGGVFGLPALAIELPISTTIMLRSIADIGRANGEDLSKNESRLACLEVFALGGSSNNDDAAESGYYAIKGALAKAVTEAAEFLAEKAIAEEGAPALVRLIAAIAAKFQIQVSEKTAAMAVPIIGAAGGSVINLLFIDHFQDMSRGHFTVRKLERKYTPALVRAAYESI